MQKLTALVHDNTVGAAVRCIPAPELPTGEALVAWRKALCERLEHEARNGNTSFELVFATTTRHCNQRKLPRVRHNREICCDFKFFAGQQLYSQEPKAKWVAQRKCKHCNVAIETHTFSLLRNDKGETHISNLVPGDHSSSFNIGTCALAACVNKAHTEAKQWFSETLSKNLFYIESMEDGEWFVAPLCPPGLAKWLDCYTHDCIADHLGSEKAIRLTYRRIGKLLEKYARQLLANWPELDVQVTVCRKRDPMDDNSTLDDADVVICYVDHGLFFDWSSKTKTKAKEDRCEPAASKKSRTTE